MSLFTTAAMSIVILAVTLTDPEDSSGALRQIIASSSGPPGSNLPKSVMPSSGLAVAVARGPEHLGEGGGHGTTMAAREDEGRPLPIPPRGPRARHRPFHARPDG